MRKVLLIMFFALIMIGSSIDPGGVFLLIFPGSRATGMGGAFCSVDNDVFGTYYNAASLGFSKDIMIGLQHANWLPALWPDMYYEYLSYAHPIREGLVLSAALSYITTGETYPVYDGQEYEPFRNYDLSVLLSVSSVVYNNLSLGFGIKYIFSFLAPDWLVRTIGYAGGGQGQAWAIDISAFYKYNERIKVGLALQNFGTPLQYIEGGEKDELPKTLRIGASYVPYKTDMHNVLLSLDLIKILVGIKLGETSFKEEWDDTWKAMGIEYTLMNLFNFRFGYFIDLIGERVGPTFGLGVSYKGIRFDVGVDQFIYSFETSNYRISAQYGF